MDYTFDYPLFMLLNFDGGPTMDAAMKAVSGVGMWIPMYMLMMWLVWRRCGWRGLLIFIAAAAVAMGLSDMVCGVFKHAGPLKNLWPSFPARWRPMYTPVLEGLDISPDSMMVWRRGTTAAGYDTAVHVVSTHGRFGTVSAHAATIVSIAVLACNTIRLRWFTLFMTAVALLICYSRIYLACHFPGDLALGAVTGAATGYVAYLLFDAANKAVMRRKKGKE